MSWGEMASQIANQKNTRFDIYRLREERGGRIYDGGRRWIGPGPGHSGRDASLSVHLDGDRVLVHSFSGDLFTECLSYLGLDHADRNNRTMTVKLRQEREAEIRAARNRAWVFCDRVWTSSGQVEGTLAQSYLTGRGLLRPYPSDVRFHPAAPLCYDSTRNAPAVITLIRSPDRCPQGLHVTALASNGSGKASKLRNCRFMFGVCRGNAAQLTVLDCGELAVAEGIETAMSFAKLKGIRTWAALSAAGLKAFQIPHGTTLLNIAADGDRAGRDAAESLAKRAAANCDVLITDPGDGLDWNDVLMRDRND